MHEHRPIANPFELMMNPEAVLQAMARSDRLERLHRRICRPLDKPVTPHKGSQTDAQDAQDRMSTLESTSESGPENI